MSRLTSLRQQLALLRRRRHTIRLGAAWLVIGLAVLWALAAMFLLDWQFTLDRFQRGIAIVVGAGVVIWAYRRYARPLFARRETDLDMALMVERQQGIDSDLVAALQFERPEAGRWGSAQLERAVIDYVAAFSRGLNVLEGIPTEDILRRGLALVVTVALLGVGAVMFPQYAATFFARLAMSNRHYPTRTVIDEVRINGTLVSDDADRPPRAATARRSSLPCGPRARCPATCVGSTCARLPAAHRSRSL